MAAVSSPPVVESDAAALAALAAEAVARAAADAAGGVADTTQNARLDAVESSNALKALKSANLSDLVSAATARTNLGVGATAVQRRVADLVQPLFVPHRIGGADVFPDNTREALVGAVACGAKVIDGGDVFQTTDGSLVVMHDTTIDRVTSGSGNTVDQTALSWQTLNIDAGSWFAPAWPSTLKPLFFEELVALAARYGLVICPECKGNATCAAAMVAVIQRYGMEASCIFSAGDLTGLAAAKAAGIKTMWIAFGSAVSVASATAVGVDYIAYDFTQAYASGAYITSIIAAGIKPVAYTVIRRSDWDAELAKGAVGCFSNNAFYTGRLNVVRARDTFAQKTWDHGVFNNWIPDGGYRGVFLGTDRLGFEAGTGRCNTLGFLETSAGTWQLDFRVTFDTVGGDASRYWSINFGCPTDKFYNTEGGGTSDGYYFLCRATGSMELGKRTAGAATALVGATASAAITDGNSGDYRIVVTPTQVTCSRVDVPATLGPVSDTAFRGKYVHIHKTVAPAVSFSRFVVT